MTRGCIAYGKPKYHCPRCDRTRAFKTWLNGKWWELRCTVCRWLRERKEVGGRPMNGGVHERWSCDRCKAVVEVRVQRGHVAAPKPNGWVNVTREDGSGGLFVVYDFCSYHCATAYLLAMVNKVTVAGPCAYCGGDEHLTDSPAGQRCKERRGPT